MRRPYREGTNQIMATLPKIILDSKAKNLTTGLTEGQTYLGDYHLLQPYGIGM